MNVIELAPGMPVGFREGEPTDHPFIFNSWLKGHREAGDWPPRLGIPECAQQRKTCNRCCKAPAYVESLHRSVTWKALCRGCLDEELPEGNYNRGDYFPPDGRLLGACSCCRFSHRRYFDEHKKVVARLLEGSKVIVACNPANPPQIMGYIVFQPPGVLHWVYVKSTWRWDKSAEHHPRLGTALMTRAFESIVRDDTAGEFKDLICQRVLCSHWTKAAERLAGSWWLVYRPFMLEAQ